MGNSVLRKEDPPLLTGQANFTDDIRLPGMLHFALLRSPHAHARIRSIDASAAKERPGVVAVFTDKDLASELDGSAMEPPPPPATPSRWTAHPRRDRRHPDGGEEAPPRSFTGWPVTEDIKIPDHWPLARGEVNFAGEPVAVVVATDRYKPRTRWSLSRSTTNRWAS
jgi:carbon-monoxide dehydrogenase large subunit